MRPALVSIVAAALLVVAPGASAGPPHGICSHVSAEKCEEILGPYNAAQFLHMYVMNKLQGRITAQTGSTLYCARQDTIGRGFSGAVRQSQAAACRRRAP
jgi:hypothetical protein